VKQNLLVLHILCGTGGKHFNCTLIHPLLLLLKFGMVYSSLRALQVVSPPDVHRPPHSPCLPSGLFSPTHNIKKRSAMKPFLIHHRCGEDLSKKREIRCKSTDSSLFLAGEVRFASSKASWSVVASSSLEVWAGECSIALLKENPFSKQGSLHSFRLRSPTHLCTSGSHRQAANLAESLWRYSGAAKEG